MNEGQKSYCIMCVYVLFYSYRCEINEKECIVL